MSFLSSVRMKDKDLMSRFLTEVTDKQRAQGTNFNFNPDPNNLRPHPFLWGEGVHIIQGHKELVR